MSHFVVLMASLLTMSVCDAVLVSGRLRERERLGSNVVQTSRLLYPRSDDLEPPCKTDLGQLGFCVDIRFCHAARRAVASGNHPVRCGWIDGFVPMVCCHPDQVQHPKLVIRQPYYSPITTRQNSYEG